MPRVFLYEPTGSLIKVGIIRKDRKTGECFQLKNQPVYRFMYHIHGDVVVRPADKVTYNTTCSDCIDSHYTNNNRLGPHCLACRREYWAGTDAYKQKGDYFLPPGYHR